ncbi:FCS-Like Zinc finger 8-like [Magnolia sinica]|uniref:FCS-Like Zinc finger 8-like n=1 Tax=Magnolia sinica TaxID=86752 RepID=UPI00265A0026|nr:FCS-Like Zinc finger 8-like [Magnolia sinica]XP_058111363.1 FCS-Like Zinc finger 8-like [Magnolia sinica]
MLRKRSRPVHKEQSMGHLMLDSASDSSFSSDAFVQKNKTTSFFSVPGLFVGFSTKGLSDYDSARSPTSPLDHKVFGNLVNPLRSPRSGPDGGLPQKSWDCSRVGLGIVDSLNDETKPCGAKILGFSESRKILFGSRMRINIPSCNTHLQNSLDFSATPKSLPKNYAISPQTLIESPRPQLSSSDMVFGSGEILLENKVIGKIRSCSSDSGRSRSSLTGLMYCSQKSNSEEFWLDSRNTQDESLPSVKGGQDFGNFSGVKSNSLPISVGSSHGFPGSLSASEIELSEDYTCVISRGPNPRTTHIYGNCILESHPIELDECNKKEGWGIGSLGPVKCSADQIPYPSDDFLSFCYSCKKKLEEGKDIYMYRGEKAFCSSSCRSEEILVEEEMEKPAINSSYSPESVCHEDIFMDGMAVAT